MPRPTTLDVCTKYLYADIDLIPVAYRDRIKRVRVGYTYWYEFPRKTETDIRDYLMNEFGCCKRSAYEDIQIIKILQGDIKNPSKAWIRYQVNTVFDEAIEMARVDRDTKGMTLAAANKAKYNMLHIPDSDPIPWDEIIPQSFEPTDDPSVLGIKKDPNIREKKRKMLEKYMDDIEIVDVPYEEMINDGSQTEETDLL